MRKAKRGGGDLPRSFHDYRRAFKKEWISGDLICASEQDPWTGLSDGLKSCLSKSVASIILFDGDKILFSCSGIAMEHQWFTKFLTTAELVTAIDGTTKDQIDLKLQVRLEGTKLYDGYMDEYDLNHDFAVVKVCNIPDVQVGPFQSALESLPHGEVLAVGRDISGKMMVRTVELNGDSRVSQDDGELKDEISSEPWGGGLLISVDGNMVGMNLTLTEKRAIFAPWGTTLKHHLTFVQKTTGLAQSKKLKVHRSGVRSIDPLFNDLEVYGPAGEFTSTMLRPGMILVNSFEDPFGDIRGEGVWRKFSKRASNLNRNVVALASFIRGERLFACTGFFIELNGSTMILTSASLVRDSGDENSVDEENVEIEVLFKGRRIYGELKHYNLHYNIALVSVNCRIVRPSNTSIYWESSSRVAAIGCCFTSGALMATSGLLVPWSGTLDCELLTRSTCKITKAGIGGPLVNLDGDVIGMNFYDTRIGTPFLLWEKICKILQAFEPKRKMSSWKWPRDVESKVNRWPVPKPCWCHPEDVESDHDDDDAFDPVSGQLQYTYVLGRKFKLRGLTIPLSVPIIEAKSTDEPELILSHKESKRRSV